MSRPSSVDTCAALALGRTFKSEAAITAALDAFEAAHEGHKVGDDPRNEALTVRSSVAGTSANTCTTRSTRAAIGKAARSCCVSRA